MESLRGLEGAGGMEGAFQFQGEWKGRQTIMNFKKIMVVCIPRREPANEFAG